MQYPFHPNLCYKLQEKKNASCTSALSCTSIFNVQYSSCNCILFLDLKVVLRKFVSIGNHRHYIIASMSAFRRNAVSSKCIHYDS